MALGGGFFTNYNKILPGAYINVVSKDRAMLDIADRGFATMPLEMDWGVEGVFRVDAGTFQKNCEKLFGYHYGHEKMKGLRDLFKNLKTGFFYRLNEGGEKAKNEYAQAMHPGIRGNDISITIQSSIDDEGAFIVSTYLKTDDVVKVVDKQTGVKTFEELKNNDYVTFNKKGTLEPVLNAPLKGGTNGSEVTVANYQKYLSYIEKYHYNVMGYAGSDERVKDLLMTFVKRLREEVGKKFQVVIYDKEKANYEGVISIFNKVNDEGAEPGALAYWLTGAEASCPTNKSLTNRIYDGEYDVNTKFEQFELEKAIKDGRLAFHNVTDSVSGDIVGDVRVLTDINTYTEFTIDKNKDFAKNQFIRIVDNWAIDSARIFNNIYLGKVQNDDDGRSSLWNNFVALGKEYQRVRNIQNFDEDDIAKPVQGLEKDEVIWAFEIQPVCAMEKLYLTVITV